MTAHGPRGETLTDSERDTHAVGSNIRDTYIAHCIHHITNIPDLILTGDVYPDSGTHTLMVTKVS